MSISPEEKRVLNAYFDMLEETSKEHAELERKMDQIESGIRSILALQTDEDAEIMPFLEKLDDIRRPEGFTEAIRKVMRTSGEALTPREV
ncbi:MAG TPA: hypothetical protein VEI49_03610, partial [Terriglobales bacterium]|nr:hypothetical protein [Terriglobales bacterium]